eukprot:12563659-Alexandrium_andersonii.AAC.1
MINIASVAMIATSSIRVVELIMFMLVLGRCHHMCLTCRRRRRGLLALPGPGPRPVPDPASGPAPGQ